MFLPNRTTRLIGIAPQVVLSREQRAKLEVYARGRSTPARVVLRARIVLLAAEGKQDLKIAHLLSIVPRTAARWRSRFLRDGIAGLEHDAPRPGRTPSISPELERMVIAKTTRERPVHATHWSTRTMAAVAGISEASVRRIWHSHGLKPHRVETFKLSNDPRFAEKLEDVVGLYLNPPEHALVLSLDEKSQIQALDRTQPGLPMKKGRAHTMTPRISSGAASLPASKLYKNASSLISKNTIANPNPLSGPQRPPTFSKRSNAPKPSSITAHLCDAVH